MNAASSITVGGLAISLSILGVTLWNWWKGGKDWKNLVPFGGTFLLGALSTMCAGGLLGYLSGCTAGVNNAAGGAAVSTSTGHGARGVAHASMGALGDGGALVTFFAFVAVVIAWKAAAKTLKRKIAAGWWAGSTLTLAAGVAGLLGHILVPVANGLGDKIISLASGGGLA